MTVTIATGCTASLSLVKVGPQDIERFKTSYQSNECYFSNETDKCIVTVVRNVYEITLRDTYRVVWVCSTQETNWLLI